MKNRFLLTFLTLTISLFASRSDDIDILLESSFFPQNEQGKAIIEMTAFGVLEESEKTMETSELADRFLKGLDFPLYHYAFETFSDEELRSLAAIYSAPAYIKMMTEGFQVFSQIQGRMQVELKDILEREGSLKPLPTPIESDFEVVDLTKENFFEEVIMAQKPILIDFSGKHCGPCRQLAPIFEKLNAEFGNRMIFARIECGDAPELAKHFKVRSIPMLIFMMPNGAFPEIIKTKVGFKGEQELREEIDQFLSGLEN